MFLKRITAAALCALALALGAAAAMAQPDPAVIDSLLSVGRNAEARKMAEEAVKAYPDAEMAWFLLARARHADGDLAGAIEAGKKAVQYPGVRASAWYNLACAYALTGRNELAFDALHQAKMAGFGNRELMKSDPDLASLRGDPRFVLPAKRRYDILDVDDARGLPYSVLVPHDFDPSRTYPVLVGPGNASPDTDDQGSLYWGEDAVQRGWIVVESPSYIADDPVDKTRRLLDYIDSTYHVEGGKFHLAGFDAAGIGVFVAAMAMPERVATVTGMPGYPPTDKDDDLKKLEGVTVNLIAGGEDEQWLIEERLAYRKLRDLGVEAYLEVIPGDGHVLEKLFGGEFMNRLDTLRKGPRP